ncbi:hypothetical protein EVB87_247 [Rhizobium phage RHph_N28_1]|nr:hypothetical protein EVB87_247 [Rhizobium phage RHph_N28_1]QIG74276.1 hypothetical protein EVC07_248 [Rhizobium phage RHph_N42]QXV73936.1 hypothetical protein [Rhizobium phage RHph_N46]
MTDTTYPNRYTALPGSKVTTKEGGIFAYMHTRYSDNHEADIVHAMDWNDNEVHLIASETEQHAPLPREFTQDEVDAPVAITIGYFNVGEGNILYTGLLESYRGQPFTIADKDDDEDASDEHLDEDQEERYSTFREKLQLLINMHSMENGSDTPDFILAHFLTEQLRLFDSVVTTRASHRGEAPIPVEVSTMPEDEFEGDEAEEGEQEGVLVSGEIAVDLTHLAKEVEMVKASAVLSDGESYDHPDKNGSIDSLPVDVSTKEDAVKVVSPGDRRFSDDGVIGD